ncbi:DUF4416 family protein [Aminomonas paucivorans]|uniref:GTP-binding protein n=1 Tax=Aminomonas paucivorans DSM 12260 TaxID=584708 RepID=E3CZ99_9BACT|nr:DUF4416 family protein [Aminomonas paucivorans]EFQ23770.1 hypothetical protein Apau_1349 [Aminomonas paucivorans DSM 12260]
MGPRGRLLVGVLLPASDPEWEAWVRAGIRRTWGPPQEEAGPFPFPWTDYYGEIAPRLERRFWAFPGLRPQEHLADWKLQAQALERESGNPRRINVDPGYLEGAKLLLASRKNHAHRIYLRDGIYGEVTLTCRGGRFTPFPYTFPDYRSGLYDPFLRALQREWRRLLRTEGAERAEKQRKEPSA